MANFNFLYGKTFDMPLIKVLTEWKKPGGLRRFLKKIQKAWNFLDIYTIFPFIGHFLCLKTHVCWIGIGIYKMCKSKQGLGLCLLWQPKIEKAKAIKSAHDKYIKNKYWLLIVRNSKSVFFSCIQPTII